jgi:hypothetical protein
MEALEWQLREGVEGMSIIVPFSLTMSRGDDGPLYTVEARAYGITACGKTMEEALSNFRKAAECRGKGETMNDRVITLEQIKGLCEKYDEEHGNFPENEYEGQAVFDWIEWCLGHKVVEAKE